MSYDKKKMKKFLVNLDQKLIANDWLLRSNKHFCAKRIVVSYVSHC